MTEDGYAETHCHSYFSLLDGASSPEALVTRARALGLSALALTDHDSLAGAVRFWTAAKHAGLCPIIGAEVTIADGERTSHLTLLAENQRGYANLCRLLTAAHLHGTGEPLSSLQPPGEEQAWPGKTQPQSSWELLERYHDGLLALSGCRQGPVASALLDRQPEQAKAMAGRLCEVFGQQQMWIELQHHHLPDDDRLVRELLALAHSLDLPCVATNDTHYADRSESRLHDALVAVRHIQSLADARRDGRLPLNSNYHLAPPEEMAHRFAEVPHAVCSSVEIARRCQASPVSLDFSSQRLPAFEVPTADGGRKTEDQEPSSVVQPVLSTAKDRPSQSEFAYLYQLCHEGLPRRYPRLTPLVLRQLAHELSVIEQAGLAGYFLTVWDIARFARERGIRCQGRGSAANSLVAYLLGITSIDPLKHNLLFERFLSADRFTIPDIDLDFAADRREEVIQYVYRRYGAAHTAMVCNVVTYQARSAVRDLGKALGFPLPVIDRLAKSLDTHSPAGAADALAAQIAQNAPACGRNSPITSAENARQANPAIQGIASQNPTAAGDAADGTDASPTPTQPPGDTGTILAAAANHPTTQPPNHPLHLLADLLRQLEECPRHLSIHTGGMLITGPPLDEVVPLERATMPGRVVCQWNKDCVEDAGLIKIDLLGLRTLGLISEALRYVEADEGAAPDLDNLSLDDPNIYRMLQQADTIGAFQVESRAQQQMLPRLKPTCFEDTVIEVAIVRPGPIQGGAVHPYLRRRAGEEPVAYLHPCLEPVLHETLGVLLFQEQAIRVSMVAAGFTPGEADMLRRAMSRSRSAEAMQALRERFVRGAQGNGIDPATAEAIFHQLEGFAGYGFCKSHAASFALIAYQTMYLKCYHAPAFYCALLNQQPMGFYSPEVIAGDARRHGVPILPPDVNGSRWLYTLERLKPSRNPFASKRVPQRRALRMGLQAITGIGEQVWKRIESARRERPFTGLRDFCVRTRLPRATVSDLIRAGALDTFGARRHLLWLLGEVDYRPEELPLVLPPIPAALPELCEEEKTMWEYELMGLSPAGQVVRHYRTALRRAGILTTVDARKQPNGCTVRVGGMRAVKQRPPTAKGIVFISLEDEYGLVDLVVKPDVYERYKPVLRNRTLVVVEGVVQQAGGAVSVLVNRAESLDR